LPVFSEFEKRSDLALIELTKEGDQSAFTEIVNNNKSIIASTIYGMIGRCDEADDIGQEVFIRFYRNISNFRGDSRISTYLVRIAINLSLNEIKRRKLRRIFSIDQMLEEGSDIADTNNSYVQKDSYELIHRALQKLNPKYRSVIVLRLIDGYSTQETAKILDLPLGTVLSRLARAQMKLKEYIKPYFSKL
jgi:RNA polymerase sigma-70 factor (ECF subfamily)